MLIGRFAETFAAAAKDRSCKHIFVAGCRRPTYLCMLNTVDDRTTVIEGSSMREGFDQIPLPVPYTAFPYIFKEPGCDGTGPRGLHSACISEHDSSPGQLDTTAMKVPCLHFRNHSVLTLPDTLHP